MDAKEFPSTSSIMKLHTILSDRFKKPLGDGLSTYLLMMWTQWKRYVSDLFMYLGCMLTLVVDLEEGNEVKRRAVYQCLLEYMYDLFPGEVPQA